MADLGEGLKTLIILPCKVGHVKQLVVRFCHVCFPSIVEEV